MSYVQVDQSVTTHRKTLKLARLLGESRYSVVGRLVALWSWSLDSAVSGVLKDVDADMLAEIMGWQGQLHKPAELYDALLEAGFTELDERGRLCIHNWYERMGQYVEQRGQASANGLMVGAPQGAQVANSGSSVPTITAALDSASYGGYYLSFLLTSAGFNPRCFSFAAADMLGVYHLFSRAWTAESGANLANVMTRVVTQQRSQAWFGQSNGSDQIRAYNGLYSAPLTNGSAWMAVDSGQVNGPALPSGALVDPTQNFLTPRSQWEDLTGGGATFHAGWQALILVDGSLLLGVLNNPSNGVGTVTTSWLWQYIDGLLTTRGGPGNGPASTYSVEAVSLQAAAHSGGGPGTQNTGALNINMGADPFLTLDPQQAAVSAAGTFAGVLGTNQLAGFITDTAGDVLPLACDLIYTPLYH
jgi:hypothetical protein